MVLRHPVGDPRRLDLALGADEALGHRRLGDEEGAGNLGGGQPSEQAQRERHLRIRRQRWVAAGEDETEPVVRHGFHLLGSGIVVRGPKHRDLGEQLPPTRLAAQAVDGTVTGRRRDPTSRVGRQAAGRPLAQRERERLLHRILGDVDVCEGADERGHRSAGLFAEDPPDLSLADLRRGDLRRGDLGVGVAHVVRPRARPRTDGPRSAPR